MPLSSKGRGAAPTLGTKNNRSGGTRGLVVCAVLSVVLFTLSCQSGGEGPLEAARGAFQTVTSPIRVFGSVITAPVRVSSIPNVPLSIRGITLSYICQNAQMDRKANPTSTVRLLSSLIPAPPCLMSMIGYPNTKGPVCKALPPGIPAAPPSAEDFSSRRHFPFFGNYGILLLFPRRRPAAYLGKTRRS